MNCKLMNINLPECDSDVPYPKLPLFEVPVPAGFPSPARDYIESHLDLNELMNTSPASTYFFRVVGDSMTNAQISDKDILVVDRSKDAINNDIVIAIIDGELTVKRYKVFKQGLWLFPENENFQPLKIEDWMDFSIWGVVTWVIHKPTAVRC